MSKSGKSKTKNLEKSKIRDNVKWRGERNETLEADLLRASNVTGIYYPNKRESTGFVITRPEPRKGNALPLPPTHLWHNYGMVKPGEYSDELYLKQGSNDIKKMRAIAEKDGFDIASGNILDFGCSGGRMLRHLNEEAKKVECWGVDIHSEAMQWARTNIAPPFHFVTNTTAGHLPFKESYFNFIYAGSVFSHIGEMDDMWLLELRRVIKKGGRLYFTFNDQRSIEFAQEKFPNHNWTTSTNDFISKIDAKPEDWIFAVLGNTPWVQRVFYNHEWLHEHLSRWFKVVEMKATVYGWQSSVTLEV